MYLWRLRVRAAQSETRNDEEVGCGQKTLNEEVREGAIRHDARRDAVGSGVDLELVRKPNLLNSQVARRAACAEGCGSLALGQSTRLVVSAVRRTLQTF